MSEDENTPVTDALNKLTLLENMETMLAALHDEIAGKGMYLAEGEPALGRLGQEIRDVLFVQLGEAVWDTLQEGYELTLTPAEFVTPEDEDETTHLTAEDIAPTPENIYTEPGPQWGQPS